MNKSLKADKKSCETCAGCGDKTWLQKKDIPSNCADWKHDEKDKNDFLEKIKTVAINSKATPTRKVK